MGKNKEKFDTRESMEAMLRERIGAAEALQKLEQEDIDEIIQILFDHYLDDREKPVRDKLTKLIDSISARIVQEER